MKAGGERRCQGLGARGCGPVFNGTGMQLGKVEDFQKRMVVAAPPPCECA